MELGLIKFLREELRGNYMSSKDLFHKSLNTVAAPAMGTVKATLWIIVDNCRGEDIVRAHYESMLAEDSKIAGKEQPIDPYGGARELAQRLSQQGYNMELTILPPDFNNKVRYIELKRNEMSKNKHDIQGVCYNLDNVVLLDDTPEPMTIEGINA